MGGALLARPLILLQEKRAAGPRLAKRKERAIELVEEFIALTDGQNYLYGRRASSTTAHSPSGEAYGGA